MDLPSLKRLEAFFEFDASEEAESLEIICVEAKPVGETATARPAGECRKLTAKEAAELLAFTEQGSLSPTPLAKIRYRLARNQ
jgi:hypothetical protein